MLNFLLPCDHHYTGFTLRSQMSHPLWQSRIFKFHFVYRFHKDLSNKRVLIWHTDGFSYLWFTTDLQQRSQIRFAHKMPNTNARFANLRQFLKRYQVFDRRWFSFFSQFMRDCALKRRNYVPPGGIRKIFNLRHFRSAQLFLNLQWRLKTQSE